jgi:hypothetical protein
VLGDALAEEALAPFPEVERVVGGQRLGAVRALRLPKAEETLLDDGGRQAEEVGLEGITRVDAVRVDPGVAHALLDVPLQQLADELLGVVVVQVEQMARVVEREAARLVGARRAAHLVLALAEHRGVAQVPRRGDAGEAAADHHHRRLGRVAFSSGSGRGQGTSTFCSFATT